MKTAIILYLLVVVISIYLTESESRSPIAFRNRIFGQPRNNEFQEDCPGQARCEWYCNRRGCDVQPCNERSATRLCLCICPFDLADQESDSFSSSSDDYDD